jgi:hypothetical protein
MVMVVGLIIYYSSVCPYIYHLGMNVNVIERSV